VIDLMIFFIFSFFFFGGGDAEDGTIYMAG
jgi:hypothetical protein